mmetsp:Transcript_102466/g.306080  ORF Transcript_102466/g.306080 Transcript_102466/m.306080 type:complete len:329 (+) Transcript_102466:2-988(+)
MRLYSGSERGGLEAGQATACAERVYKELGLARPCSRDLYLAVTVCDTTGCNRLDREALVPFLGRLFSDCAHLTDVVPCFEPSASSTSSPPTTPRPPPLGPPPSPADAWGVTLRTISGELLKTALPTLATTDELRAAVARSPLALPAGGSRGEQPQHRFAVGGRVLRDGLPLEDQGLRRGDFVEVVRVTPPPACVRLECHGFCSGPSIRGSCGTFCLVEGFRKNDRPVYARDRDLSKWNRSMLYHGDGERFLLFEEHPERGGRWALTDDRDWARYGDRSYAFIVGDAPHPGYLEGQCWRTYRDAKGVANRRDWVELESFRLVVEEGEGE